MYDVKIDCYGIVVTHTGDGGGSITSELHEEEPERKQGHSEEELSKIWNEFLDETKKVELYNAAMDALESMILAHSLAGIDVTTPAYMEGIETAVEACANNT